MTTARRNAATATASWVAVLVCAVHCGGSEAPPYATGAREDASTTDARDDAISVVCPAADEVPAQSTTIVVRNHRPQSIYVLEKECSEIFAVTPSDPAIPGQYPPPYPARTGMIVPWCSSPWRRCASFHGCDQQGPFVYEIRAGDELSLVWPGTIHPVVDVAKACRPDAGQDWCDQCMETRSAKRGRHMVTAEGWSASPWCASPSDCPCEPYSDGTCRRRLRSGVPARDLHAEVEFDFPANEAVTVSFW